MERSSANAGAMWWVLGGFGLTLLLTMGAVVAIVVLRGSTRSTDSRAPLVTLAPVVDGIPCNAEDVTYHEHAHLAILEAGNQVTVPANIGIVDDTCLYWLHTHDDSGEIHMEAPKPQVFTLGEFFDVWHRALSRHRIGNRATASGQTMRVYVNGAIYNGNPRDIVIRRHTQIGLEIGPPFARPAPFDFQGD